MSKGGCNACTVCHEYINLESCVTECSHVYHLKCFWKFVRNSRKYECKACGAKLYLHKDRIIDSLIECRYPIKIPFTDEYRDSHQKYHIQFPRIESHNKNSLNIESPSPHNKNSHHIESSSPRIKSHNKNSLHIDTPPPHLETPYYHVESPNYHVESPNYHVESPQYFERPLPKLIHNSELDNEIIKARQREEEFELILRGQTDPLRWMYLN